MSKKQHSSLFLIWMITLIWGIINLYSASNIMLMTNNVAPYLLILPSILILSGGTVFYHFIRRATYANIYAMIKRSALTINLIVLGMLCLVLLIGVDAEHNLGAKSIIDIGPVNIQPMEFYKVSMLLYIAYFIYFLKNKHYKTIHTISVNIFLAIGLIFLEHDLGGVIIITTVLIITLLIEGEIQSLLKKLHYTTKQWLYAFIAMIGIIILLINSMSSMHMDRFSAWINPFSDAKGAGYQLINAFIAFSNGGLLGNGFLNSTQKTGFLTEQTSDAIFAIIGEEWGLFGILFTIIILFAIVILCYSIAIKSTDKFSEVYAYGFGTLIFVQTAVNIGGITGTIPLTGVTLPFISSGTNSLISLTIGLFFVIVIDLNNKHRKVIRKIKSDKLFMDGEKWKN